MLVETATISPGRLSQYLGLRNLLTCKRFKSSVSLAKPDPSAKRVGLVASQYGVLYGRNAIIT